MADTSRSEQTRAAHRRAAVIVFFGCFVAYVGGLSPEPYWLDSSEFAAAGFTMGVAHPPGHPLAVLMGRLFSLLPLGSVALRVGLASAVFGAGAAALLALVAAAVARRAAVAAGGAGEPVREAILGTAAGAGFGFGYAAAFQAVRPEVYALHTFLSLLLVFLILRFDDPGPGDLSGDLSENGRYDPGSTTRKHLYAAALVGGLALANHHFLAVLAGVAAAGFVLLRRRAAWPGRPRALTTISLLMLCGALGLAVYAYLPLRALRHPLVNWGAPSTISRFVWVISAAAFQKSLSHAGSGAAIDVAAALARELGALAPAVPLGAYALLRLRPTRRLGLFLLAAAALDAASVALVGFDPNNPDAYGYLETAVALSAVIAVAGISVIVAVIARRLQDRARDHVRGPRLVAALFALACAALALADVPRWQRARFADTGRFAAALLDAAPPRALVITSYFQTVFAAWYARAVEGRRPDADHVHRHFLAYPGYRDGVVLRAPDLAPLLGARDISADILLTATAKRPILIEYDIDTPPSLAPHLEPLGAIYRIHPISLDIAAARAASARALARRASLSLDASEPQTRRVLLWQEYLAATLDCDLGRPAAAPALARARALVPDGDTTLDSLAARCR